MPMTTSFNDQVIGTAHIYNGFDNLFWVKCLIIAVLNHHYNHAISIYVY